MSGMKKKPTVKVKDPGKLSIKQLRALIKKLEK